MLPKCLFPPIKNSIEVLIKSAFALHSTSNYIAVSASLYVHTLISRRHEFKCDLNKLIPDIKRKFNKAMEHEQTFEGDNLKTFLNSRTQSKAGRIIVEISNDLHAFGFRLITPSSGGEFKRRR